MGPSHNYQLGRAEADVSGFVQTSCEGMEDAFAKVAARAEASSLSAPQDKATLLRELRPLQSQALGLFAKHRIVSLNKLAAYLGLSPRQGAISAPNGCRRAFWPSPMLQRRDEVIVWRKGLRGRLLSKPAERLNSYMNQTFIVEPLNPAKHCREEFDCGVESLNDFLRLRARKEMEAGTSACFVMVPEDEPTVIAGYYTLSAATVLRTALPESVTKKLPRYNELPATLLGRLARDLRFKGQQIGERLIASMLHRPVRASEEIASWAIVTDPKDEKARAFYASFGFQPLTESRQFITLKSATQWISAR